MSHIRTRLVSAVLALALVLGLAGCGESLTTFTWEVEHVPANLDPQLAEESPEVIAVTHLFSGLYRKGEDGSPAFECAERCVLSADGLTYTFTLKEGLVWSGYRDQEETPLTAADFVFGLQRTLSPETRSPWADELSGIQGAQAVLTGEAAPDTLGVSAPDDRTLVIRLESPDADFPARLCLPGAMPCNRAFFESTAGAYGLGSRTVLANGGFYLYSWTESGLFLRRAAEGERINNLRLVLNEDAQLAEESASGSGSASAYTVDTAARVEDEKATAAWYTGSRTTRLTEIEYAAETWVLLYNTGVKGLDVPGIRAALDGVVRGLSLDFGPHRQPADGLVPPAVQLAGGSYREQAGAMPAAAANPRASYLAGLAELNATKLSGIGILVPKEESQLLGQINQAWQKELSAFFTVEELTVEEIRGRVAEGDYQIALLPLVPASGTPLGLLEQFADRGLARLDTPEFNALLAETRGSPALAGSPARITLLERTLLEQVPATPLFYQSGRLVLAQPIDGLVFDPFGQVPDVTGASLG